MSSQDFSRINELFYPEVGDGSEAKLASFIKDAFKRYEQKNLQGRRIIFYTGQESELALTVARNFDSPDLLAMRLTGSTPELEKLLEMLKGNISAEFSELKKEALKDMGRVESLRPDFSMMNNIAIYIAHNQDQEKIKKIVVPKDVAPKLNNDVLPILLRAGRITITNSGYVDDDTTKDLYHEQCTIIRRAIDFSVNYSLKMATDYGMPFSLFPHMDGIFNVFREKFNNSYRRAKVRQE